MCKHPNIIVGAILESVQSNIKDKQDTLWYPKGLTPTTITVSAPRQSNDKRKIWMYQGLRFF